MCSKATEFEGKVVDKELKAMIVRKDGDGVFVVRLADANGIPLFSSGEKQQKKGRVTVILFPKTNFANIRLQIPLLNH